MSQFDFGTIDPNVKTGTQLAADLNDWRDAMHSTHAGAARPSYAVPGMLWFDQVSGTEWDLYVATASGDVAITSINPTTNYATHRLPDGTLALPALSFINEHDMGLWRSAPQAMQFAVGGVAILGITDTAVAVTVPLIANDDITAVGVVAAQNVHATGGTITAFTPSTAYLHSQGVLTVGADATHYGQRHDYVSLTTGTTIPIKSFVPNGATAFGYHEFKALTATSLLRVAGGAYNTGSAGASLSAVYGAVTIGGIDMVLIDGTAGAELSEMRFSIIRNGAFTSAGDLVMKMNNQAKPQFLFTSGWNNDLMTPLNAPLISLGNVATSNHPGLCLYSGSGDAAIIVNAGNSFYFGCANGGGPISGWAMTLTAAGGASAATFTPISDAELKADVAVMTNALAALLKLRGVRYKQKTDGAKSMGLIAQEVATVFPELVGEVIAPPTKQGATRAKYKTLNYNGLHAATIEAIREIEARLKKLESK